MRTLLRVELFDIAPPPVVYLLAERPDQRALLARLGRHKMGKSCLYFKRLADLDVDVLEVLIAGSVADVKRRYPSSGA